VGLLLLLALSSACEQVVSFSVCLLTLFYTGYLTIFFKICQL
jgi:hypothetical protein